MTNENDNFSSPEINPSAKEGKKKNRNLIVGGVTALILIVIVVLVVALSGGSDDKKATSTKPKTPTKSVRFNLWVFPDDKADFTVPTGETCDGSDVGAGFYDITSLSQIIIRNATTEKIIKRVNLGSGKSLSSWCAFTTHIDIKKGSDNGDGFTFEVNDSDRGTVLKSWDELDEGISISLGELAE